MRGRNKEFLRGGILPIFRKNWGIVIAPHEIDYSLSYSENFGILYRKHILLDFYLVDL